MQAHVAIAHLAIQFGLRHQGRNGIDHHDIDTAGGHQRAGDFERLLTIIGLGHDQVVHVDTQLAGVDRVQRVFGVNERGRSADLLSLRDHLQGQGRLAR